LFFIAETSTCIMSFTSPADLMLRV
jgi:hypothetical protein